MSRFRKPIKPAPKKGISFGHDELPNHIDVFKEQLDFVLQDASDVVQREVLVGTERKHRVLLVFTEGLIDKQEIEEHVLKPLLIESRMTPPRYSSPSQLFEMLEKGLLSAVSAQVVTSLDEVILGVLSGICAVYVDGHNEVLLIEAKGWPQRSVPVPAIENVLRGPRDAFTETLRVNTALIRRRWRDPNIKFESFKLGRRSKTDVALVYVADLANQNLVKQIRSRLQNVNIDLVLETGYIEQLIEDNPYTPFPTCQTTERPDSVAAALSEGRIAILVDGTPLALIVPATLNSLMQSPEDYYNRFHAGTLSRLLRFVGNFLALVLPGLYIALTSYHPEMLPGELTRSIAASRSGVPFPAFVEAFLMEGALELLREAGVRLPSAFGQTIGIVGGLIVGEAAVSAGLVSPGMVIVVAVTAISNFSIPSFPLATSFRILRFAIMIGASALGLFGLVIVFWLIAVHLVCFKSFGVPYLAPWTPFTFKDLKDTLIRLPLPTFLRRPLIYSSADTSRQEASLASHGRGDEQ